MRSTIFRKKKKQSFLLFSLCSSRPDQCYRHFRPFLWAESVFCVQHLLLLVDNASICMIFLFWARRLIFSFSAFVCVQNQHRFNGMNSSLRVINGFRKQRTFNVIYIVILGTVPSIAAFFSFASFGSYSFFLSEKYVINPFNGWSLNLKNIICGKCMGYRWLCTYIFFVVI